MKHYLQIVWVLVCLGGNALAQCVVDDPANQTVCNLGSTSSVTFSGTPGATFIWVNDQPSIGLISNGSGNIPAFTAINLGTTPVVANITVTPVIAGCTTPIPQTFSITVNSAPNVNPVSDQVVCHNSATALVSFSGNVINSIFNWTNNNTSIGLAASGSGNIPAFTAINSGTSPVVATITVTPSFINNGVTCTGTPESFTITVNPVITPVVSIQASPSGTICPGKFVTFIATATNTGGGLVNYTWKVNSSIKKNGLENFYGKKNWFEGDNVICEISVSNATCVVSSASDTFVIHLKANIAPSVTITALDDNICIDDEVTFTANTNLGSDGADNYLFRVNGNTVQNGSDSLYVTDSLANNDLVTCEITASGCVTSTTATSNTVLMTVADKSIPAVTISTTTTTICNGSEATFTANAINTGGGTVSYQFKVNGFTQTSSGNIFTTNSLVNNDSVSCEITISNFTCLTSGNASSNIITMSVVDSLLPTVSITSSTADLICAGDEVTFSANAQQTGGNLVLYNFKVNDNTAKNSTDSFFTTNSLQNNDIVSCEITVTQGTCLSSEVPLPDTIIMKVNPAPDVNAVSGQTVCNGAQTTAVTFSGSIDGTVYNWTNDNTAVGLGANGSGIVQAFTAVNAGTSPVIANITVAPIYTNNGVTCTGTQQSFAITVNPTPLVNPVSNQTVCNGAPTTAVSFFGNMVGTTYNWINTNPSIGLIANGSGTIPSFNAINSSGSSPVVATITVTPDSAGCSGSPQNFEITVNPPPTIDDPLDQVVCSLTPTSAVTFTGNVTGSSYSWNNDNTSVGLASSGSGDIASFTATNTSATISAIANITVTPYYTNNAVTCEGAPQDFSITVNPIPVVDVIISQIKCNGAPTDSIKFSGTGTFYNWTNNNPSIGLLASGVGDIPSFTASNTGSDVVVANISVTPGFIFDGVTCFGDLMNFSITVYPTPSVDDPPDQIVCNGTLTDPVIFTGAGAIFTWENDQPSIGLIANGSGNIPAFTAINLGTAPVFANITVTPEKDGCFGTPKSFTITVNPTPAVNAINDTTYCNGEMTGDIIFSSTVDNAIYSWSVSGDYIGLNNGNGYYIQDFVATNNDSTVRTALITVYATANDCVGLDSSFTFTITVNPSPPQPLFTSLLLNIYPVTVCQGSENVNFNINTPAVSDEIKYQWTSVSATGVKIGDDSNPNTVISFYTADTYNITATVTNKPGLGSCTAAETQTVYVTEKSDTLSERAIILKNPGNLLVYPDNSMYQVNGYQWGFDTMMIAGTDTTLGKGEPIVGQVYQVFIPEARFISGNALNTHDYAYWVLLKPDNCQTKVYFNGPYAQKKLAAETQPDPEVRVNVFPNPNDGSFVISLSGNIYGSIDATLSNAIGMTVYNTNFQKLANEATLKVGNLQLPDGLYLLKVLSDDHQKVTARIIITH